MADDSSVSKSDLKPGDHIYVQVFMTIMVYTLAKRVVKSSISLVPGSNRILYCGGVL